MEREVAAVRVESDLSIMKFRYENVALSSRLSCNALPEIEKEERGP